MKYSILRIGESRSFPQGDSFPARAAEDADVVIYLGAFHAPGSHQEDEKKQAVLIELDTGNVVAPDVGCTKAFAAKLEGGDVYLKA